MSHTKGEMRQEGEQLFIGDILVATVAKQGKTETEIAFAKDFVHRWNSQPDLLDALSHIKDVLEAANKRPNEIAVNWKVFLTTFIEDVLAKAKKE